MSLTVTCSVPTGELLCPQVAVTVAASPAVMSDLTVTRVHEDGSRWPVLTDRPLTIVDGAALIDYHPPQNQAVRYEAVAAGQTGLSEPWEVYGDLTWLVHPADPTLAVSFDRRGIKRGAGDVRFGAPGVDAHRPVGARRTIHRQWAPEGGQEGELLVQVRSPEHAFALRTLLADGGQLLLSTPWTSWQRGYVDLGWMWVQFDERAWSNLAGWRGYGDRLITLPYVEDAGPDVDVVSPWDWTEATGDFESWAALTAAYESQTAFELDIRT